ncbi:site-specific integrase [Actinoplanes sp. TFC3]|uniref:tyrosine-type recombinase/integrase n=1 Tax=Actinoplanes sp. TFC3 TaxID=1710355 RepID=UPI0008339162|nr:site-specific integrase [Actinoplanes sp. TFC3]
MAWVGQRGTRWRVRYRNTDGTVGTDSSHPTFATADLRRKQVDIDQAYDTYLDPNSSRITLTEWVTIWREGHEVGAEKWATYDSYLRNHILPRFGDTPLNKITRQDAKVFVKDLKRRLAERTVADVMSLLGLLLREAVADRRIDFNPCTGIRVITGGRPERTPATTHQINHIAERIPRRSDQILVITAAYTGMRWGELAGLSRTNVHLGDGFLHLHPTTGALHEVRGKLYLGTPKTTASTRDIHLPPFLISLLQEVIDSHDHETVFCGPHGAWLRRSTMSRRIWRPAVNGNPTTGTAPILKNMHFHDNRHTHKTWLIEDDLPEIAQARCLGHHLAGVRGIYSHVTPVMIARIINSLEDRWQDSRSSTHPPRRHLHAA